MRFRTASVALFAATTAAYAQAPAAPSDNAKQNANPCREEVAAALKKLRGASWFRMNTSMITEKGPVSQEIEYVLPDKMHQKVTEALTQTTTEIIMVGEKAWGNEGKGWQALPSEITNELRAQMQQSVVEEQAEIGNYSCKGKTQLDGKDVLAYKLEEELQKDSSAPKNETYRMFYVDALTGLPVSNALLAPGRESKPLFKASYTFPVDLKIEAPKDVVQVPDPAAGAQTAPKN